MKKFEKMVKVAPSLLDIDYGRMDAELKDLARFADMFHVDVMDGDFVPNISIGLPVVRAMKTKIPLDCHLMISHPDRYIQKFADAGAASITIHAEASTNLKRDIRLIKKAGCRAAVAINPETPVKKIAAVLPLLDMVLVMSVHPGFGGQSFIDSVLKKVTWIRKKYPALDIQIDGGINDKTAPLAVKAGANVLVAGSYLTHAKDRAEAIRKLNDAIQSLLMK